MRPSIKSYLFSQVRSAFLNIRVNEMPVALNLPVQRFVSPSKFNFFKFFGENELNFLQVVSSPLTRSSYHAEEIQKLMKKHPR